MTSSLRFRNLLVVIKQTAYEEYSQLKLRGQAPKALRWKRLESRYKDHKSCVNDLLRILRHHKVDFSCVNRVELDRQHLANVDLVVAVGGDGTVLSSAHFLDHGTIPLLGINSDPITTEDQKSVKKKKTDERRSHGALCMCTANDMEDGIARVLHGGATLLPRTRIQTTVKSTFSETRLVPALNDLLIANPSPAAVSRFRMGWLEEVPEYSSLGNGGDGGLSSLPPAGGGHGNYGASMDEPRPPLQAQYGTVTRFGGIPYDVTNSLNVWSSGMWVSTATGSSAAMAAAGGKSMSTDQTDLQYLIREHMIEKTASATDGEAGNESVEGMDNGMLGDGEQLHLRWNSQKGRIFIDGSHLSHNLELGDEVLINNHAPPLQLFLRDK
uniref:NAD(+) kinase n=1 Tax=Odontella aurita TaxID=265563 RepID=A0A7S4I1B0_9STRA